MPAPTIDRLVTQPGATVDELRRFTQDNGGRTRLLWTRSYGAVARHESLVLCATSDEDIRRLLDLAALVWGDELNVGTHLAEPAPPRREPGF